MCTLMKGLYGYFVLMEGPYVDSHRSTLWVLAQTLSYVYLDARPLEISHIEVLGIRHVGIFKCLHFVFENSAPVFSEKKFLCVLP